GSPEKGEVHDRLARQADICGLRPVAGDDEAQLDGGAGYRNWNWCRRVQTGAIRLDRHQQNGACRIQAVGVGARLEADRPFIDEEAVERRGRIGWNSGWRNGWRQLGDLRTLAGHHIEGHDLVR